MEGFNLSKKGESLETVINNKSKFSLLAHGDGVEILTLEIEKDKLFYVYPSENPSILEFYFILSGELMCELNDEKIILGPEDYFSARDLTDHIHFTALSNVTILWMTTEPTFVHLSKKMSALVDIVKQVEAKDRYTYMHSDRVANYSIKIAKKMKLTKEQVANLTTASYLHDIGKIHVPEAILNKQGRLTDEEYTIIKKHPTDGAHLVRNTSYEDVAVIIEQHHERLNGSGYPLGLKGDEILIESRIIAVSDTFDAMTEDRVYRKAMTAAEAFAEINRFSETLYDPEVVQAFEKVLIEEGKL
ncbi:HD-GYP domain-containing protein [Pseudoneobacillus sp. C159]